MESDTPLEKYLPVEVNPSEADGALYIKWQDGHSGVLPYPFLRGACPCAVCKGHHGPVTIAEVVLKEGVFLVDVLPQGSYALRLLWSDTHQTGIYTYGYLRTLCRCKKCTG